MLSKNDMSALRGLMREAIIDTVPGMIESNNHILKREIRDEVHSLIKASEVGILRRMDAMHNGLRTEILDGVAEIIGERIVPQIDDLDRRVTRLEFAQ